MHPMSPPRFHFAAHLGVFALGALALVCPDSARSAEAQATGPTDTTASPPPEKVDTTTDPQPDRLRIDLESGDLKARIAQAAAGDDTC